ncbi:MAG: C40 family peptidase, partial [Ruminiclostridium sp.]
GCGSDTVSSDNNISSEQSTTTKSESSDPQSVQTTTVESVDEPASSSDSSDTTSSENSNISDLRSQIVDTAEALVGIDYVSGMASPETGFDNSGLIYYVLRENGFINCPRGTSAQIEMGTSISFEDIQPGDLVFFTDTDSETGEKIDFGGIYIGDGKLIYSPYPGEKVKFADINSDYWKNSFSCAVSVA